MPGTEIYWNKEMNGLYRRKKRSCQCTAFLEPGQDTCDRCQEKNYKNEMQKNIPSK